MKVCCKICGPWLRGRFENYQPKFDNFVSLVLSLDFDCELLI